MRVAALFSLLAMTVAAASDDTFVLRGVTVHPVTAPDMENVSLLVRDGRIAEIALKIPSAKGLREIQAKGLHVYPGMIDSATTVGLSEISAVRETSDIAEIGDFNPQLRAAVAVNPASEHIPVTRASGITAVITAPEGGIISGQASLMHLDGWTWEQMELRRSAAMVLTLPALIAPAGPRTSARPRVTWLETKKRYEGRIREVHEFFEQARLSTSRRKSRAAPASRLT